MANPHKGESSIEIDGKPYTLALTLNAMCELEALLSTPEKDVTFLDVLHSVTVRRKTTYMRAIFWAALQEHHPGITVKDAGTLIQRLGGLVAFAKQLDEILKTTQPDKDDLPPAGAEATGPRPLKAQVASGGTGDGSSLKPAASA